MSALAKTICDSLVTYLRSDPRLAALIVTGGWSPGFSPPVAIPAGKGRVTFAVVSNPRFMTLRGASGMANPNIQLGCWAHTYDLASEIFELVRHALDGYRGVMGNHFVGSAFVSNERDGSEPSPGLEQQQA